MALAAAVFALLAPVSASVRVDLIRAVRPYLVAIHRRTRVPVLLPRRLPLRGGRGVRVYTTGGAVKRGWNLELAAAPRCGGADACFVASFAGRIGTHLPRRPNLRLQNGARAYYHGVSCGGSCAPASLWFVHHGVTYGWQVKEPPPHAGRTLARLAAAAIAAGPR